MDQSSFFFLPLTNDFRAWGGGGGGSPIKKGWGCSSEIKPLQETNLDVARALVTP